MEPPVRHRRRSRRIPRALGAAAGGLLGAAFFPTAAAFADDYDLGPAAGSVEKVTGIYGTGFGGADTAPPAVAGTVQGNQLFDYTDTTSGDTGTFNGDESSVVDGFGDTNEEVLVTHDVSGSDAPPVGSVFDTYTVGDDSGYENIYSAVPTGTGSDVITDTWVTPDGDYTIPMTFDAADVSVADTTGVPLSAGDDFFPDADSHVITAINGIPPLTMAIQGLETFDIDNAAGTQVGSFGADETTTADGVGTYTEAVMVTKDLTGTDDPGVGSIFNTIVLGDEENIYSDVVPSTGGPDVITDTVVTPLGDYTIPTTFDAAAVAENPVSIALSDGDDIAAAPDSTQVLTGINGLPPVDVGVQGQDTFDLDQGTTVLDEFDADETTTVDEFGDTTQTLLVTGDLQGSDLPVGSVIETVSLGTGYENIYTDIASTTGGADTYTDTLVTPFGDFSIPVDVDAAAGLGVDHFLNLLNF
jgi:hypothetical protein